jgi:DNA-directed RNA polymerase subunit RPC12/RpoP
LIDFFCALCGSSLSVSREFEGNVVECPACAHSIPVPGRLNRHAPATDYFPLFSPNILSIEMTFACPGCERPMMADARYEGVPFSCPVCSFSGSVPTWSGYIAPDVSAKPHASAVILSPEELEFLSSESEEAVPITVSQR